MTDEQRASAAWLEVVEYGDGRSDEQIIAALLAHIAAVRLDERRAIVAFLRAWGRKHGAGLADAIERGEASS